MNRKIFYFLIVASCLIGVFYFFTSEHPTEMAGGGYCAFCDPAVLKRQTFYEDDLVLALYSHRPIFPGHSLIIPRRHVERFENLTDEEITQIGRVIKQVHQAAMQVFKTSPYLLLQKNGPEVGQSVPHVHFHYIPRKTGDGSTLKFLVRMYLAQIQKPISAAEMEEIVKKMNEAMLMQKGAHDE